MAQPHTIHEWRVRDAEAGEARYFRAWRAMGRWHFRTSLKSYSDWTDVADPDEDFLAALQEKLLAKYRRRRLPWEQVEEIEKLLENKRGGEEGS